MHGAGIRVESSKGEAWPGQHEVNFRFADALTMADNHMIYKNGAKEIALLNGCSITFMAKPFESWIGNSCHIHSSLFREGAPLFGDDDALFDGWLAGQIACFEELALFLAPTINSYKRYAAGSWAPTTLAWGHDNRTCGFRIVGHGGVEARGDSDPRRRRQPVSRLRRGDRGGAARDRGRARAAAGARGQRLRVGREALPLDAAGGDRGARVGAVARAAFGDQVVDHYLNYARTEQALFDHVVTDGTRQRFFERGCSLSAAWHLHACGPSRDHDVRGGGALGCLEACRRR